MKTKLILLGAAATTAATLFAGPAAAQTDPAAAVQADVTKLLADASARHDTLIADAQKLTSDAQSLQGAAKNDARKAIRADLKQLRSDRRATRQTLRADWKQLKTDLKAARKAKVAASLKSQLQQLHATLKQERLEVRQALAAAHQAVQALRASLK